MSYDLRGVSCPHFLNGNPNFNHGHWKPSRPVLQLRFTLQIHMNDYIDTMQVESFWCDSNKPNGTNPHSQLKVASYWSMYRTLNQSTAVLHHGGFHPMPSKSLLQLQHA